MSDSARRWKRCGKRYVCVRDRNTQPVWSRLADDPVTEP